MRIAIIPARGGSKRIPKKNIRLFEGTPIIAYSIQTAVASGLFDHVIVSTDDDEIATVAEQYGAAVPFRRPSEFAGDNASTDAVLIHAIEECQERYGVIETACCLYPAAPFITPGSLQRGFDLLVEYSATSSFPVVPYDFPIEQAMVLDGVRPRAQSPAALNKNSQAFGQHVHDAGMFYWCDPRKLITRQQLFCDDSVAFVVSSHECQDINTLDDWHLAEIKYRVLRSLKT